MIANITTGKDIYGALAYNQCKVDRGKGAVLATSNIREPADGRFGVAALADELLRWMPSHVRTEKPVVHISLNPDPEDRLSDDELTDIAAEYMEGMGWGGQPYVVYKHTDIDRPPHPYRHGTGGQYGAQNKRQSAQRAQRGPD